MEDEATKLGYTVLFGSSDERADRMDAVVNNLINKGVDGLVIVPCEHSEQSIASLVKNNIPLVLFDRYFPSIPTSHVLLDNYKAAYQAVQHLLAQGSQAPCIVASDIHLIHMEERVRGYREAMQDAGKDEYIRVINLDLSDAKSSANSRLHPAIEAGCDSFIFSTNMISVACLYALKQMGQETINKLRLIGFDGTPAFDFFSAPITCIRQPVEEMVRKALQIIIGNIGQDTDEVQMVTLEGEFQESPAW
jgi:LacI family transcriptional regulator